MAPVPASPAGEDPGRDADAELERLVTKFPELGDQLSIPHRDVVVRGPCEWCGNPVTEPFEIERPRHGRGSNKGIVLKRAVVVPACAACARERLR